LLIRVDTDTPVRCVTDPAPYLLSELSRTRSHCAIRPRGADRSCCRWQLLSYLIGSLTLS